MTHLAPALRGVEGGAQQDSKGWPLGMALAHQGVDRATRYQGLRQHAAGLFQGRTAVSCATCTKKCSMAVFGCIDTLVRLLIACGCRQLELRYGRYRKNDATSFFFYTGEE